MLFLALQFSQMLLLVISVLTAFKTQLSESNVTLPHTQEKPLKNCNRTEFTITTDSTTLQSLTAWLIFKLTSLKSILMQPSLI